MGYGAQERVLMIHADDIGMSHSVNRATIEALREEMVTSGSIMVPCPWFPEIAAYFREHPELDLGLHLTLTSEWNYYRWGPVASPQQVPNLVDPEGFLWRSVRDVASRASAAEVETELRAQIERALAFGIRPTHLDTHMGTLYARPDYFQVYRKLGKEYSLPIMVMRPSPELEATARASGSAITAEMLREVEEEGFPVLDHLVTGVPGDSVEERRKAYHELLRNLKPGVTMLIVHLGGEDEELKAITRSWRQRYADFVTFTAEETRQLLRDLGIRLTTWRELGKLGPFRQNPGE